jgi:hypothetical protein
MQKEKVLTLLLVVAALLAALGLATLVPAGPRHDLSDMGYYSWCPFAPWSTLALLGAAGVAWVIRSYLKTSAR